MEKKRANLKPSLQQSARANAAAEPGINKAPPQTSHDGLAPFVDSTFPPLAESTFPAGAAYNHGIAFPNGPGHYIWPEVAAGPMDEYANTNSQYLDPPLSVIGQYATGFTGNGHGGHLQANGFNSHTSTAGAFPNASHAINNCNSYGGQSSACGFGTQLMAPGANSSALHAIDSGNVYEGQLPASGLGTPLMAPDAYPSTFRAIDSSNVYGGQLPANGFDTPLMVPDAYPSATRAIYNGNVHGGHLPANGLDTPLMAPDAHPSASRAIDSSNVYGGQFPTSGFQTQPSVAFELPNAPRAVDGNATHLGPAQVAPARHTCPECNRAFKRKGELNRHAKKHQADSKDFRCVAAGCGYSSYRKDRLDDHVERRHAVTASASASAST